MTNLIAHERGNGPANLVVAFLVALRTEQDEEEAGRDGHLGEVPQQLAVEQAHKGDDGLLQEVHLSHQHVGGLRTRGDLLEEVRVGLARGGGGRCS